MRWDDLPESRQRRGSPRRSGGYGGGGGWRLCRIGGGGLGIGTIVVLGLIGWALGIDPSAADRRRRESSTGRQPQRAGAARPARRSRRRRSDEMGQFVAAVLGSTEVQLEGHLLQGRPDAIARRVLVLYRGRDRRPVRRHRRRRRWGRSIARPTRRSISTPRSSTRSRRRFRGCDVGSKACQFSQAYVIAHEVGHHVQNLLGILPKAQQLQRAAGSKAEANHIQVRVELQADCFAGVWANQRRADAVASFIEPGDIEAALRPPPRSATTRCRSRSQGYVVPDSFTHGTSEQRQRWFMTGFTVGHGRSTATRSRRGAALARCHARHRREQTVRPAEDRGADRVRHARARRRQVRRDAGRAHREGRATRSPTRAIVTDDVEKIRAQVKAWIADPGDRRGHHHRRHRLHRPRRHAGGGRAAVREAHGRLLDAVPDGEPRQDRHLGDPDARHRRRRRRDLHLLPAGLARRLPRRLGRDPGAPARLPLPARATSSRSCRGSTSICAAPRRKARRCRWMTPQRRSRSAIAR